MEGSPIAAIKDTSLAYDEIFRLERNLLAASKAKGPFDPAVRRLRTTIRDSYEVLLLRDLVACESLEVEQALWRLHYREIEGFRARIRKLLAPKPPTHETVIMSKSKKRKKGNQQEPLLRALTSLKGFLAEASGFFNGLLIKLRLQNGLACSNMGRFTGEVLAANFRPCMVLCHKIMIYLGDLARYKELYGVMDTGARDWSVAANYYKQAAFLWPASGNPYNQLAVLCTYCGNSLTALYQYCRSLSVRIPFATAWDNLALLFEKSPGPKSSNEINLPINLHGFIIEQDLWSTSRAVDSHGQFVMYFVKLVGVLLCQSSVLELEVAVNTTSNFMEHFLDTKIILTNEKCSSKLNAALALQVMVILIFCMHHMLESSKSTTPDDCFLAITLKFTLKFSSLIVEIMMKSQMMAAFPIAVIFMEWIANQPKALLILDKDKTITESFKEFHEKVSNFDLLMTRDADLILERSNNSQIRDEAQWEDHELLGFVPLLAVHSSLDFSSQLPAYGVTDAETCLFWKLRYVKALQKSAKASGILKQLASDQQAEEYLKIVRPQPTSTFETRNMVSTDAGQVDAEDELTGTNVTPSLKEWIERTYFSPDPSTLIGGVDDNQQVLCCQNKVQLTDGPSQAALEASRSEEHLSCSDIMLMACDDTKRVDDLESKTEAHELVVEAMTNAMSPTRTMSVSIAGASNTNSQGPSSNTCSRGASPLSGVAGCVSPCSSLVLKDSQIVLSTQTKKWLQRPILHEMLNDLCPRVHTDAILERDAKKKILSKDDYIGSQRYTSLFYNKMRICTSKAYESQNPFVLRLRKCFSTQPV